MVLLPTTESFAGASGFFNGALLDAIFVSFIDKVFIELGRPIIVHLRPAIQQDTVAPSLPQPQQYSPFFGRAPLPSPTVRDAGVRVTHRDIPFTALSRIGPKPADDTMGIGMLQANEAAFTISIDALPYIQEAISISFEGRRYQIDTDRPFGFKQRKYLLVFCTEINEADTNKQLPNG